MTEGRKSWWKPAIKWTLVVLVLWFVFVRVRELLGRDEFQASEFELQPLWLLPAAGLYLVGWLPSVWFWRRLIDQSGGNVGWFHATRAYYCGHLGKYVPGKAMALVIRAALLKSHGCRPAIAALTGTCETLLLMLAGGLTAVALSPILARGLDTSTWPEAAQWAVRHALVPAGLVVLGSAIVLPVLAQLLSVLTRKLTPEELRQDSTVRITTGLLASGLVGFVVCWFIQGLAVGCLLRSAGAEVTLDQWPVWTGAAALATAGGFFALFAPGGVGVRELLLIETLRIQPEIGPAEAVAAAILMRLVWLVTEIIAAGGLYWIDRETASPVIPSGPQTPSDS